MTSDLELSVTGVVAGGDGLARDEGGRVVFVGGALPGERVRAAVTEEKRGFARARLVEVLDAAPGRTVPACPHVADGCGGCTWQHLELRQQGRLKVQITGEAFRRIGRVDPPPIAHGPELAPWSFRTTVRAAVRDGRAGLRHHHSHDVVVLDRCLVAHPLVEELLVHGRYGAVGEVVVRAGVATGERLVWAKGGRARDFDVPSDVAIGSGAAVHEDVAGRRWRISARSFFQARPDGAAALVAAVRAHAQDALGPSARLVDLYSGVGLFAGALAADVGSVEAVEGAASAVRDARANLQGTGATVVHGDVGRWRPSPADVVVADPSRAGLGRDVVARIAATGAARLVLVSCDPAALGRDAGLLAAHGYRAVVGTLVDLFPHTPHVEVVTRFDRHPGGGGAP